MCCYRTLQKNEHGYVVKCNKCAHLHVAFGNTVMAFTTDQFHEFVRTVRDCNQANSNCTNRHAKMIQIPTAARSITLVYSINEIQQLLALLEKAEKKQNDDLLFNFCYN
jgi:hypothetical protein